VADSKAFTAEIAEHAEKPVQFPILKLIFSAYSANSAVKCF
jgi:hypothetical protein